MSAQNSVQDYISQREINYMNGQSISDSDFDFSSNNGEILKALIQVKQTPQTTYIFETFRNINDNNKAHVLERIYNVTPNLIGITNYGKVITATFNDNITEGQLNDFFKLFGFSGYKIMKEE